MTITDSKKSKSLVLIISLLLVVLIVLLMILVSKDYNKPKPAINNADNNNRQTNNTNQELRPIIPGWKVYENKKLGFRIDRPENWKIKEYNDQRLELTGPQTLKLIEDGKNQSDGEYYGSRVDIIIFYYSSIEEEYVNKANKLGATTIDELVEKDITMEKIGEMKIDNRNAIEVIEHGEGKYYNIFVENNGHLYKVFFPYRQNKEELSEIEKQILSTFQLVK
jgi:hypothetical protein